MIVEKEAVKPGKIIQFQSRENRDLFALDDCGELWKIECRASDAYYTSYKYYWVHIKK